MEKRTSVAVAPTRAQLVMSAFPRKEIHMVVYLRRIAISTMRSTTMTESIGTRDAASKLDRSRGNSHSDTGQHFGGFVFQIRQRCMQASLVKLHISLRHVRGTKDLYGFLNDKRGHGSPHLDILEEP